MKQSVAHCTEPLATGGALGVGVAALGTRALIAISPAELPRMHEIGLDGGALLFALGVTAVVGVVVGVVPALLASRRGIGALVRARSSRIAGGDRRIRRGLVVAEVVLAVVLLVNGGLLLRSLDRLLAVDPGFDGTQTLTMQVQTVGNRFDDGRATHRFFAEALAAVRGVPGVETAAFTSQLPLSGDMDTYGVHLEARPAAHEQEDGSALRYAVTPEYFDAMRIPLLRGRQLTPADDTASAHVVLVNERFAQQAFGATDPLGQRLRLGATDQPWTTIVGIVGNVKQSSLDAEPEAAVYLPTVQSYFADPALWLVVRTRGNAASLARSIEAAIHTVDAQPVTRIATMESRLDAATAQQRMMLRIFQLFGVAALLLAAIGVYGVQAGGVAERTNEIGVRAALGATRGRIVTLVLSEGLALAAAGVAIGLLLGASASGIIASMLYGISRFDLPTYLAVAVLLVAMVAFASTLPAWRATQVDPSTALRGE